MLKHIFAALFAVTSLAAQATDVFGRLEVANPRSLGEYRFESGIDSTQWGTSTTGTAAVTYTTNLGSVSFNTPATADTAVFQTHKYHKYQAAKAARVVISLSAGTPTANTTKEWGYFDADNGLFFRYDHTGFYFIQRNQGVDTAVELADMNGDGAKLFKKSWLAHSGVFEIHFQWLGSGISRGLYVSNQGTRQTLHTFDNTFSLNSGPYMRTGSLPLRFSQSKGATAAVTPPSMVLICSTVISSGGEPETAVSLSLGHEKTTTAAEELVLIAYQPKETDIAGRTNRGIILPLGFDYSATAGPVRIRAYANSTLTGGEWLSVGSSSATSYTTDAEISVKGEQIMDALLYAASGTGPASSVRTPSSNTLDVRGLTLQRNAFNDGGNNIVITIQRTTTTNATAFGAMRWEEIK